MNKVSFWKKELLFTYKGQKCLSKHANEKKMETFFFPILMWINTFKSLAMQCQIVLKDDGKMNRKLTLKRFSSVATMSMSNNQNIVNSKRIGDIPNFKVAISLMYEKRLKIPSISVFQMLCMVSLTAWTLQGVRMENCQK